MEKNSNEGSIDRFLNVNPHKYDFLFRKLTIWHNGTFSPIYTHDQLEPIMASVGFFPCVPDNTLPASLLVDLASRASGTESSSRENEGVSAQELGNNLQYDEGVSAQELGNNLQDDEGVSAQELGNNLQEDEGVNAQELGNKLQDDEITMVQWREYEFGGMNRITNLASNPQLVDRPRLPYPRVDGLHLASYLAFFRALEFHIDPYVVANLFHVRYWLYFVLFEHWKHNPVDM